MPDLGGPNLSGAEPAAPDRRRPVHVLTGFLGSGKTTVLRHLLRDRRMAGTAVLINEAGAVGLDHLLVGAVEGEPVLLESGCLCCTIRGDLVRALHGLIAGPAVFDRIVIETTGLADPAPVLATISGDLVIRRALRAGRVLATVDVVHAEAGLQRHAVLRKQAMVADVLLLTKSDLAPAAAVRELLHRLNPLAAVHVVAHGAADPALLTGPDDGRDGASGSLRDWSALAALAVPHGAQAVLLQGSDPLDYDAFAVWFSMLVHRHGDRLLRVKALLDVAGSAAPVVLHAVQHLVHPPEHLEAWPAGTRASRVVIIGEAIDAALLRRSWAALVLRPARPALHREAASALGGGGLHPPYDGPSS